MPHNVVTAVLRCYDLGPMQSPFSSWSTNSSLSEDWAFDQVIADIEELLREPIAEFEDGCSSSERIILALPGEGGPSVNSSSGR